ncbi:MAG: adenylyl-sulfate kinase [Candidatus Thermoplasmatota archaeon]|nr:adenylyl-sulfate kinase [Candidatus Thermoplasmatota archaeon]
MRKQKGFTVWFTGLPCCGKTTIARKVAYHLKQKGYVVEHLDGDIVRKDLTSDLGFSKKDREENLKRVTFVAKLLTRNDIIVLATFVSPYKKRREQSRKEIGSFVEIYVRCPVDVCMKRDVKGMYKKALAGKIEHFTGVQDPYEEPDHPELMLETDKESVEESVDKVLKTLEGLGYITL